MTARSPSGVLVHICKQENEEISLSSKRSRKRETNLIEITHCGILMIVSLDCRKTACRPPESVDSETSDIYSPSMMEATAVDARQVQISKIAEGLRWITRLTLDLPSIAANASSTTEGSDKRAMSKHGLLSNLTTFELEFRQHDRSEE